jgi:LuxR family maltose regulon positive regulatory protein
VDEEAVRALVEETAGWIGGIVMAGTMHRREWSYSGDGARPVSGLRREFEAYFDEEVMALEPARTRTFLVDSAVLDELTPAACAAVTGCENGRRLLEEVEQAGLFVEASGCERAIYRYHPLFREMILRRLYDRDQARAAELHRRASRYFAEAGDVLRALDHAARSGDQEFLADQLERLAETAIYSGYLYRLSDLAATLPPALLKGRPNLLLAMSWRQTRTLAFATAETLINMAEAAIGEAWSAATISELEYTHLLRTVEHRRIMLMAARDEMAELEPRAEKLLAEFGDGYPYLSCTLLAQLMAARRELYHFHDTLRLEAETRRALHRPGSDFASIALKASAAPTLAAQGKVEAAEAMLREAFGFACSLRGAGSGLAALPGLPLAELLYDRGRLREARSLSEAHLPAAREWGFVDQLAAGHIVQARLLATDGRIADALRGLNESHLLSIECGLDRLRAMSVAEQVRILIRNGQLQEAEAAFAAGDLLIDQEPLPTLKPTRKTEAVAVAWLRIEIHNHRLIRARKVAKRWSELVRRNGAVRSAVVFELLLAQIGVLSGERSEARRAARAAVALATPAGWTQIFLDEGPSIGTLLAESYEQGPSLDSAPDRFAAHLVDAFKGKPAAPSDEVAGLDSRLASRELDILAMVGGGLRNREIGDRLGLTEGTVKWYMQQIYDKLGVRRRPQAVMRARQLGVLA